VPGDRCKSCNAPIFWARTDKGRAMPLDLKPVAGASIIVTGPTTDLRAHVLKDGEVDHGFVRYTSHFATCPQAKQHRRKG
jgi:hypothetical protein